MSDKIYTSVKTKWHQLDGHQRKLPDLYNTIYMYMYANMMRMYIRNISCTRYSMCENIW